MIARIDPGERIFPLIFGLIAVGVGFLAGYDPKFAIAAAFAVAFLLLALADLSAGVVAFAALVYLELAPALGGPALSFSKVAGAVLGISFLAAYANKRRQDDVFWARFPFMATLTGALVVWHAASYFWAERAGDTMPSIIRILLDSILLVIMFEAVRDGLTLRRVLGAMVVGSAVAAVYGIIARPDASVYAYSATAGSSLGRLSGTIGDPNELASLLIVGLVLAGALAGTSGGAERACWVGAFGLCTLGVFLTASRGGLVSLAAVLVAALIFAPRRRALVIFVVALIAGSAALYYTTVAPEGAKERLTIGDGGTGRTDIWKIAGRMIEDNPVIGVGANNFQIASIHYLLAKPGAIENDTYVVDEPLVTHNIYLHVMAELGIIGFTLFMLVLLMSITCAVRAARAFKALGDRNLELLCTAIVLSVIALLAGDFFLSGQYSKELWLLIALGPATLAIARRAQGDPKFAT